MEIKPIFVIRLPLSENRNQYLEWLTDISNNLKDYHVLAVMDNKTERVEFECYNIKDHNETEFNELKDKLLKEKNNDKN